MASSSSNVSSSEQKQQRSRPYPRASPLMVARSTLSKVPLSYCWTVTDAKVFLGRGKMRSPHFSTLLPLRVCKRVIWCLTLAHSGSNLTISLQRDHTDYFLEDSDIPEGRKPPSKILFSEFAFFVLNPQTKEILFTREILDTKHVISKPKPAPANYPSNSYDTVHSISVGPLQKYMCNGGLTVQVDAKILCYSDPVESMSGGKHFSI